jgi:uncharacterized membrane protein YdbT with pleckstrin-like domain
MTTYKVSKKYKNILLGFGVITGFVFIFNSFMWISFSSDDLLFDLAMAIVGPYSGVAFWVTAVLLVKLLISKFHTLEIDSTKITYKKQFITKSIQTIESHQLEGVSIKQGPVGRILNYGKLRMTGTGGLSIRTLPIDNVYAIAQEIRNINPKLGSENTSIFQNNLSAGVSSIGELEKLSQLLEKGLITREEFDSQKRKLLG